MPNWIGDAVMATPAIENLKKNYENLEIVMIASTPVCELFRHDPDVLETFTDDSKKHFFRYKRLREIGENVKLKHGTFDFAITFQNNFPSVVSLKSAGVKKIYGLKNRLRNLFLTSVKFDKEIHQAQIYNTIVNFITGKSDETNETKLFVGKKHTYPRKTIGINPGAKYGSAKRWEPHKFAEVALNLSKDYDIVIFGTNEESDISNKIESVLSFNSANNYQNMVGRTSIYELLQMISSLDLFITNDSGPMHIAGAFQVPTVTIFGSTNHIQTCQWKNSQSKIIKTEIECAPCMKRVCPLKHHKCMKEITAEEVISSSRNILEA